MRVFCKKSIWGNLTLGKSYLVVSYRDVWQPAINPYVFNHQCEPEDIISLQELKMLTIIGDRNTECNYLSDKFYNNNELRKLKIKKLNGLSV